MALVSGHVVRPLAGLCTIERPTTGVVHAIEQCTRWKKKTKLGQTGLKLDNTFD